MQKMMMRISAGKGEGSSSSTSLVLNNSDLLIKILLSLPVKTLLVLKPVSKHWYALISDSYFREKHCQLHYNKLSVSGFYFLRQARNGQPSYGMILPDKAKISRSNVSFVVQVKERLVGLYIQQSCNGLLLCNRASRGLRNGTRYIYNPSTRQYRMIPPPPLFQKQNRYLGPSCFWQFYLAFSPSKSPNYEILFLWRTGQRTDYNYQMAIYSSKTSSWGLCGYVDLDYRLHSFEEKKGFRLLSYQCVIWNGCLNWIDVCTLVYFNIAQRVVKTSQLGDEMQKYLPKPECFEECMGHMYLILRDNAVRSSNCFGVFEMEIDYSAWKPICRVVLDGLANQYRNSGVSFSRNLIFPILKVFVEGNDDEDELKALIIIPDNGKIVSYDVKTNSLKEICSDWYVEFAQHAFIESLADV